jgi:hypothetical protein
VLALKKTIFISSYRKKKHQITQGIKVLSSDVFFCFNRYEQIAAQLRKLEHFHYTVIMDHRFIQFCIIIIIIIIIIDKSKQLLG